MKRVGICLTVIALGFLSAWIVGCETSSNVSYSPVTIDPTSENIAVGTATNNVVEFTASGGDGSYYWNVDNTALGSLVVSNNVASYTPTMGVGVNRISVTSNGQTATATVSQH